MISLVSPTTQKMEKPERKSTIVDRTLEVSSVVLVTLQDAAKFAQVPYLQDAASLALSILNMVAATRGNKQAFREVANEACELVCVVVDAVRLAQGRSPGMKDDSDLLRNIRQLVETLTSIDKFARKEAKRNVVMRFIRHQADMGKIEDYRRRLQKSLDIFGLQSNISISEHLNRISRKQDEIMTARALEEKKSLERVVDRPVTPNKQRDNDTQPSPAKVSPVDTFASTLGNVTWSPNSNVKITAVDGNFNDTSNSSVTTNNNSGNSTTTTITGSYNDSSYRNFGGGVGVRGNRGRRRNHY